MQIKVRKGDFQDRFLFSGSKFPAMIAAIGTGKTLCLLGKIYNYCEDYPGTTALIVRKEYTDLRDSTIRDFERYFQCSIDSNKEYKLPNKSVIMFRHAAEIAVLKNINIGIAGIEQAEEFSDDTQFQFIRDRLRQENGAKVHPLCVIGNVNGDNWIKHLWKDGTLQESELFEATTFDNQHNLPEDFIADLKRMEKEAPAHYKQYVLNDWTITIDQFMLISPASLEALKEIKSYRSLVKRLVSCDPATGGDECVLYMLENDEVKEAKYLHENDTMKIAGEMQIMARRWSINDYVLDSIGLGKGVGDRLREMGGDVVEINSASEPSDKEHFYNLRAEMWWYVSKLVLDKELPYPQDPELRRQLTNLKYKVINSNGRLQLESKDETRKRLGRSPDRADAFVYGVWQSQYVAPYKHKDRWAKDPVSPGGVRGGAKSAMLA